MKSGVALPVDLRNQNSTYLSNSKLYFNKVTSSSLSSSSSSSSSLSSSSSASSSASSSSKYTLQHKLQILSLKDRAFLKSVLLVHNLIYSNTSNILSERISYYRPLSSLRSAKSVKLNFPKYNYETIMGRSFCVSAPTNWNKLPTKLRCEINYNIFRRKVKLFLLH